MVNHYMTVDEAVEEQLNLIRKNAVQTGKHLTEIILPQMPYDTGYMFEQQFAQLIENEDSITIKLYNDAPYSVYVHQGTGRQALNGLGNPMINGQAPQQFIRNPVMKNLKQISIWLLKGV